MNPARHDCAAFLARWNAALDAREPPHALDPGGCPDCARAVALADVFNRPLPAVVPQPDFTACAVAAVLSDRRRRARLRAAAGLFAVAAGVVVAVTLAARPPAVGPEPPRELAEVPPAPVPPAPPPKVGDVVAGAGASLAALSDRVAGAAPSTPALPATPATVAAASPPPDVSHVPAAARAGFEPLAAGTRRAAMLFLRDAGLAPKEKS